MNRLFYLLKNFLKDSYFSDAVDYKFNGNCTLTCYMYKYFNFLFRYIICEGLRPDFTPVLAYMKYLNAKLQQFSDQRSKTDIREVVPLHIIKQDEQFFNYIYNSNEE